MFINIKLDDGAILPTKAHKTDAGFDLYAPERFIIPPNKWDGGGVIDTGVHMLIPDGYVGMIKSKSGLNIKHDITTEGVIDAGYTGSIVVKVYNYSSDEYVFEKGDKVTQIVIIPIANVEGFTLVDEFEDTERGEDGFGSSGR